MSPDLCEFCSIIEGDRALFSTNPHISGFKHPPYQSEACVAWPDAAPLTERHVLLVPKTHALSISRLKSDNRIRLLADLAKIADKLLFRNPDQNILIFEHGSSEADTLTGCSITHNHLHIVLSSVSDLSQFEITSEGIKYDSLEDLWCETQNQDYYLLGRYQGKIYVQRNLVPPELRCNMLLRKEVSQVINEPQRSDYRRYESDGPDELIPEIIKCFDILEKIPAPRSISSMKTSIEKSSNASHGDD